MDSTPIKQSTTNFTKESDLLTPLPIGSEIYSVREGMEVKSLIATGCIFLTTMNASGSSLFDSYVLISPPGCYTQQSSSDTRHPDYSYDSVTLKYSARKNIVSVQLTRRSSVLNIQNYICDSKEHTGDGDNTGDVYIARCTQDLIEIRREFKQLVLPLIVTYQKTTTGLDMTETFEGSTFKRQCSFIPISRLQN